LDRAALFIAICKRVVIHVITWITWVETIKRQTSAAHCCLVASQSPWVRARSL